MIKGGYYIKARKIQNSAISKSPPHVREIWDWILKEANHKDNSVCKRGQCIRTYNDIREGLAWYIGWRKMMYSKWQCEIAMKWLKKATMLTTQKTTRGILITVLKYDLYQDPKNYESHTVSHKKATRKPQTTDTINKNEKNDKNINNIYLVYKEKINSGSLLTRKAKDKLKARLKTFKEDQLLKAIDNFSQADWWMENNAHRGVAWFFHSDDRIDQFLNLKEAAASDIEVPDYAKPWQKKV